MKRAAIALVIVVAACAAPVEDVDSSAGAQTADATFYGDDRVGKMLRGKPDLIPADFAAFERLFEIGRACKRRDSKEIFVVEETQTRLAGPEEQHAISRTKLMPRAVVTGCNTGDLSDPESARHSYSLMAALISDPGMHDAAAGDTMRLWPLEVMALDETTGLYNFYVFEPAEEPSDPWAALPRDAMGRVTRIYRSRERSGKFGVFERRFEAGHEATPETRPIGGGDRCFNCHVHGAPLMNEIRDPWTNWVSFKKTLTVSALSGTTKELVREAVPNTETGRSSLANDLEPTMRSAIQRYTFGTGPNGWAHAALSGELPGGLATLFESVFCETELNYTSADQSLPIELFLDPDVANLASYAPPPSYGDDRTPFQLPIRSVRDKETENWLVDEGYLDPETALAIRLVDDENDIFSSTRCALHARATREIPSDPRSVREAIRRTILFELDRLPFRATHPKRAAYMKQLLTHGDGVDSARVDYLAELASRYEAFDTSEAATEAKAEKRKERAKRMFDPRSNPLPILDR